jgi:hypothetical protein
VAIGEIGGIGWRKAHEFRFTRGRAQHFDLTGGREGMGLDAEDLDTQGLALVNECLPCVIIPHATDERDILT